MSVSKIQKPLNRFNFVTWYDLDLSVEYDLYLNRPYERFGGCAYPALCAGDVVRMQINTVISDIETITLRRADGTDTGITVTIATTGTVQYVQFTAPTPLDSPFYRVQVDTTTDPAPGIYQTVSNWFKSVTEDEENNRTSVFSFRNNRNLAGYDYSDESFRNQIRLFAFAKGRRQYETELSGYKSATTGHRRNFRIDSAAYLTLETYWFNDLMHEAMNELLRSNDIEIDGHPYSVRSGYEVLDDDPTSNLASGSATLFDSRNDENHKPVCDEPAPVVPHYADNYNT